MIDLLKSMRYPGRFLAVGMDGESYVALYGATGRSPSSVARRFVREGDAVYMGGIDDTVAREGNPELLEYPAVRMFENGIVIANGRQIENISSLQNREADKQLSYAMREEAYEPDEYRTPRITGVILATDAAMDAAINIVRSAPDGIDHASWRVPLQSGSGSYISTYTGEDIKPTPSFHGEPRSVKFAFGSAKKAAQAVFNALVPEYRVGVIAVYLEPAREPEIAILNRHD